MRAIIALLVVWGLANVSSVEAQTSEGGNLCANPGLEMLNPAGDNFPLSWQRSGGVTIDKDAHAGGVAVRMSAKRSDILTMNSDRINIRIGTARFHYKTVSSSVGGANLQVYVIALSPGGKETVRTGWTVPSDHVGDGQWHQGTIDFDFSSAQNSSILIAPRINELSQVGDGEWLLDDFECIARKIGPRPVLEALYMPDPVLRLGKSAELVTQIANTGDEEVPPSRLRLLLPDGVRINGEPAAELRIDAIAPGDR